MGDILKEAIADAKAVRETALQNAKMALEEAFTPQLKNMLSAKLKEDEFEDEEEFGGEEEAPEVEPEMGDEEEPEEGYYGEDDEVPGEEVPAEEEPEFGGEDEEEFEGEGLELEDIIRELEQELRMEMDDDIEESDNPYDGNEQHDDYSNVSESDTESDDDTNQVTEDEEVEIDESILDEDDELDEEKEEVDEVDKSSGIGKGDNHNGESDKTSGVGTGGQEKATKMESVQAELAEYKEAVSFLKDKLHEVNILNAKLLFTNKLFKEFALDNNQKLKVVETFDRAQTTREIKLVYSTLAEQFGDNGSITKKSIKESASAKAGSTKPSNESQKVITEESAVADRFKKLAGIIKG
jgi:hypothetical protein